MAIAAGGDDGDELARRGSPGSRSSRWLVPLALLVPAALALAAWLLAGGGGETLGPVRGLRLGIAPSPAREALVTDRPGSFSTLAMGEDFALVWAPEADAGELGLARLEFHLGQLVAVRLTLTPAAPEADGPELQVSEASVLTREPTSRGVELTWLARSCPTHADEVRQRIAERS
jgi:hypothetical protein